MLTVDQINALSKRVEELKGYLGVEQKRMEIAEDEKLTQDPEFWNDPKEAEKVMKRMRTKKSWVQAYDDCASAVDDLVGALRIHEGRGGGGVRGGQGIPSREHFGRGVRIQKHAQCRGGWVECRDANHVWGRRDRKLRLGVHAHADVPHVRRQKRIQGQGT